MAQNKFRLGGLVIILVLTLLPATAFSAPKITPGSKCKIFNQKITYLNKTYTCLKSGKNLRWNKGVLVAKSKPAVAKIPIPVTTPKPEAIPSPIPTNSPEPIPTQKPVEPSDTLNFKGPMVYDIRDGKLIRRADSGSYFATDSRAESTFDPIRIKAYRELNKNLGNRLHPNVEFKYSISDSFPKFLIEYTKHELDEAAALWDSFIGRKITVNVYLVTEKDRENIKNNRWLQMNLPDAFTRFDSKRERPFITGGGGYWRGDEGWFGNIYLGTASYLDSTYVNYEWPQVARHEFVHLAQDFAFARNGRLRGDKAQFDSIQPQNFREGSANTISYLTAFRNIGWSSDAMDWLIWQRAEYTKNWRTVKTLAEVKALMIATDVGTPNDAFEQSYAVGALMYEWLIGSYGFDGYTKLINEFANVSSFGEAVQNVFGVKKEELYDQMAAYVFSSYQKVYAP